jgi:hypothetical protein
MNQEQLRKVLENMGLDPEKLEQLMRSAGASSIASSQISRLGEAMAGIAGGMGGLLGAEMAELAYQLGEMEALQDEFFLTQAALDEIARSIGALGGGGSELGGYTDFREGSEFNISGGTGDPGRGQGNRDADESGQTAMQKTQISAKANEGPMVASLIFDGLQVKGESKLQLARMVEQAQNNATEAISENEIPRKFEPTIKKYFGALQKQTDKK